MKKFIKQIITFMVIIVLSLAFIGYYLNYRVVGDLSFCITETMVYSSSDFNNHIYTLEPGECFVSLTNFDENDSIKIRFENVESGEEEIGFIKFSNCYSYLFPLADYYDSTISKSKIILSLKSDITFDVFLEEFVKITEDYEVIGVYMEDSDYSEEKANISVITSFCDELKIPYGFVSSFNSNNVQKYINFKDDTVVLTNYNILPQVFNLDAVADGYKFDEDLSDCIFQSTALRNDNIQRYWITSSVTNHGTVEEEVMLITLQEDSEISYVSASSLFEDELLESYNLVQGN